MDKLKIYLADLTYDTVSLSTESFPLNIGYVASYSKSIFQEQIEITLFKYINELEKKIFEEPPDILGLSNYAWNHMIDLEMFKIFKQKNPNGLTVWGGPNFPLDRGSQIEFMKKNPQVDVYVPLEGEIGFSNIIDELLKSNATNLSQEISKKTIDGCVIHTKNDEINFGNPIIRTKNLDDFPSPYLTGVLDKFFDGRLSPMLQTNRGCPFSCSFCVDGNSSVTKVNSFSLERVKSELDYIGRNIPSNTHSMFISDLNFGMIPRDLVICDYIAELQEKFGFPKQIQATTGKNSKERIIEAIKRLNGALRLWMSVQSLDQQVLQNIRRSNISTEQIMALAPTIKEANLRTTSEVILGLPGESYLSHIETIKKLVKAEMDHILIYTCMMLNGSEMNTPSEREKWGLKTKFRILPRDFVRLSNGKNVIEVEEVIVSNNTLSFDEYVKLRLLAFVIYITNIGVVYDALLKFLREKNIDVFELFYRSLTEIDKSADKIQKILKQFEDATTNELWDSPEQIISYYQNDSEFQKLLDGDAGINVLQYFHASITADCMEEWTEYIIRISGDLLAENYELTFEIQKEFETISNYCRGISHKILSKDRMQSNPIFNLHYDVESWLKSKNSLLTNYEFDNSKKFIFKLDKNQFKVVEDKLNIFGNNPIGRSQVIKRTPIEMLWRKALIS